jgi:hypothetical protein
MALNCYVMPIIGAGVKGDPRRPKYLTTFQAFAWGMFDYGNEPQCLVGVVDINAATDTALTANNDVYAAPTNLNTTVGTGATLTRLRSGLEADNLPGTWIQSTTTYRQIVAFVGACCQIMQRYQGQGLPFVFQPGVTLDTTYGTLPAGTQQGLLTAAQSFGLDTSILVSANALRTIIQNLADQYTAGNKPLVLAGVSVYTA